MISGLPLSSWVLIITSVGLGLLIELRFFLSVRGHKDAGSVSEELHDKGGAK